jgi:hypothetical protein
MAAGAAGSSIPAFAADLFSPKPLFDAFTTAAVRAAERPRPRAVVAARPKLAGSGPLRRRAREASRSGGQRGAIEDAGADVGSNNWVVGPGQSASGAAIARQRSAPAAHQPEHLVPCRARREDRRDRRPSTSPAAPSRACPSVHRRSERDHRLGRDHDVLRPRRRVRGGRSARTARPCSSTANEVAHSSRRSSPSTNAAERTRRR